MAITTTTRMIAHLTVTTEPIGSLAASSLASVPGMAGVGVMDGVMDAAGATDVATVMGVVTDTVAMAVEVTVMDAPDTVA